MAQPLKFAERRTNVESVYDHLYEEIVSMRLLPGTKISESEIAALFGISRQPVRDAFSRLANLNLLLIRPQRATEVKGFSSSAITKAMFVRASVEAEVLRRAARACGKSGATLLESHLANQREAVEEDNYDRFRLLDYDFHKTLCVIANVDYAFDVIAGEKAKVDRLCVLGLTLAQHINQLLDDHVGIANKIIENDESGAVKAGMLHLARLDTTISALREKHATYFYD